MSRRLPPLCLPLLVILAACGAQQSGWFFDTGFHVNTERYGFRYLDTYPNLLPPGWKLDNFVRSGSDYEIKTRGAYRKELHWTMADGSVKDAAIVVHDLIFHHTQSNGTIWVRRMPLPRASRDKAISVLAENYANGISGSVYDAQLGSAVVERRVSTKVISSVPLQLGAHAAHDVVFEMADLNQLELDPNAPRQRTRIVMVKGQFDKPIAFGKGMRISSSLSADRVPAVLLLGYANDAAEFDAHAADFQGLLTRLWIR